VATPKRDPVRAHVIDALTSGHAHAALEDIVKDFPAGLRGAVPTGAPYSAWQLLEHIRLAQEDILAFSRNHDGTYKAPKWPDDYWPSAPEPPSAKAWDASVKAIQKDREAMAALVADPKQDLFTPFPWGEGQTLLREALLIVDHNSYHLGQMVVVRRLLGAWSA